MAKLSQYQSVFRITKPDSSKRADPKRTKRKKQLQATLEARNPSTLNNGEQVETFPQANGAAGTTSTSNECSGLHHGPKISEAQIRLQKLEEMVTLLMQMNKGSASKENQTTTSYEDHITPTTTMGGQGVAAAALPSVKSPVLGSHKGLDGHLDTRSAETQYIGATHWTAILEHIKDIQGCLGPETDEPEDDITTNEPDKPDIVFANSQPMTLMEAYNSLPDRSVVGKTLSVYFGANYLHIPFIHKKKFLREYESFWNDPSSVPFLWVSMLFSALHLGSRIARAAGQELFQSPKEFTSEMFLMRASQILTTAN
ncbi:uncharacterized protein Z518_06224 [Rhinocladiella mackenziei CBS 650.93]|uniref:Transcription factor domain-containing protein n=1 Tax=Rhinocladiella mackenziei CBS 650.93 TaxID=1442369 RepID=A0A0D2FTC7_9EURO|nr:uncharacterized protein Z518_06224 [Rhinocladiella mackenziei CBS 650.93]KIX05352.1 hypothetical protein Z518_06224 [Rhinocladiella mackenziei CBS 650.93]